MSDGRNGGAVSLVASDVEAALVGPGRVAPVLDVVAHHAEFLEHVAADVHALVAGDAAVFLEALVTELFPGREDVGVAQQVLVET